MRPKNRIGTVIRPLRLDENADRLLAELANTGLLGKSKAEVATAILWQWFWENQERLAKQGIELKGRIAAPKK